MAGNTKHGTITKEGLIIGRGDKRVVVDPKEVEKLARLHCTMKEIAEYLGTTADTISYHFADIITKAKMDTKNSLRRAQLKVALDGNVTMLIWLGKQMLSQSESPISDGNKQPLPWSDDEKTQNGQDQESNK